MQALSASTARAPAAPGQTLRAGGSAFCASSRGLAPPSLRARLAVNLKTVSSSSSVRVDIQGRHLELTPAIKEHTLQKIGSALAHFDVGTNQALSYASAFSFAAPSQAMVRLSARSRERQQGAPLHKAEVTITTTKGVVRAECEELNLYAAVDKAATIVERQLRKQKEREVKGGVHTHHAMPSTINDLLPEQPAELDTTGVADKSGLPPDMIRRKIFHCEAVTVAEAVERMEQVGHSFFVFRNVESGEVEVVYARNAGGYGVLVPRKS